MNRQDVIETYTWQTAKNRREELVVGETRIASMVWRGWFSVEATGTIAGIEWVFDRPGFFNRQVEVRTAGAAEPEAIYSPHWTSTSGTLDLSGGRTYGWQSTNFWGTRWQWEDASGTPLVRFVHLRGIFRQEATVELLNSDLAPRTRALLLLLGWYLISLYNMDTAAAAAAVGAGA